MTRGLGEPSDDERVLFISRRTLAHYDERAEAFWAATRDHDVRQNIDALLSRIEGTPPYAILDFGCGPGRDLRTLTALGHVAVGLEGAANFVTMAREYSGRDSIPRRRSRADSMRTARRAA